MEGTLYAFVAATVAFFIAILSGLGVGSGGLFVIWLTAVYGVTATQARGMNLLFFVFSASAALVFHYLKGRVDLGLIFKLAIFAVIGTIGGTWIAKQIDSGLLRQLFGVFLVASGTYSIFSKKRKNF